MKYLSLFLQRLTFLLALLLMLPTTMWGEDQTLFYTDFGSSDWNGHSKICSSTNSSRNTETINGITFVSASKKQYSISSGALTFCNNNSGNNYIMGIPISNVNGSVTVTITTVSNSQRVNYLFKEQTELPTSGISCTSTAANINTNKSISIKYTMTGSGNDLVVLLGRQGSDMGTVIKTITITTPSNSSDPSINASNVTLEADATSGEIAYTISNPAGGVNPTIKSTTGDWISNVQINTSTKKVTFDATANTGNADRTATITISYTGAKDKVVTITQKKHTENISFKKVNSIVDMVIGGTYVWYGMYDNDHAYIVAPFSNSNTYFSAVQVGNGTPSTLNVENSLNYQNFELNQVSSNTWTIKNANNNSTAEYLRVASSNKNYWVNSPIEWTIGTHEKATTPTLVRSDSLMQLNYNSGTPRFVTYKGTQKDAFLYHLASESAHTLSLNPNYGEEEAVDYLVKDGYSWLPVAPSRSGFEFQGWATTATGKVAYAPTASYTMPANASELFAVWKALTEDPEITPSVNSVNVSSEKLAKGTATFTISGANLTSDLSLVLAEEVTGLTVSPASIAISNPTLAATTITVSYVNDEAASGVTTLNIKHGDDVLASVTVNYTSTAALKEIANVTSAMTWDFSGYTTDVQLDDANKEVVLANYVTLTMGDASMLKGKQQYIVRNKYCWQGTQLTFHPTVPGTITVVWSSTSGSNKRTLAIGDEKIKAEGSTTTGNNGETTTRVVPANQDVVLTGWNVTGSEGAYEYTSNQIRIWKITFTPTYSEAKSLNFVAQDADEAYWATFSSDKVTFWPEDVVVSKVSAEGSSLNSTALDTEAGYDNAGGYFVPANTGVLIYSLDATATYYEVSNKAIDKLTGNMLYPASKDKSELSGCLFYQLAYRTEAKDALGFYWAKPDGEAFKSREGSAYLAIPTPSEGDAPLRGFAFSDLLNPSNPPIVTDIDETLNKYVKSGKVLIDGKLYIIRDNKVFDLNGRMVK